MNLLKATRWPGSDTMTNTEESPKRPGAQTDPTLVLVIALAVACWVYFLAGAGTGMNVWSMSTLQFPPPVNPLPMAGPPAPGPALLMIGMWWSMMVAMMIPGALRHFPKAGTQDAAQASALLWFGLGYAGLWLIYSVAAVCLQFIFVETGLIHGMTIWSIDNRFSAILLALAGIYQFTGFKTRSLNNCRETGEHSSNPQSGFRYGINCLSAS